MGGQKAHLQNYWIAVIHASIEAHLAIFADQLAYLTPAMAVKP